MPVTDDQVKAAWNSIKGATDKMNQMDALSAGMAADLQNAVRSLTVMDPCGAPVIYNQRNPVWADDKLGTTLDTTIGSDGCLMCDVAMCLTESSGDCKWNPSFLNRWLVANGGYVNKVGGLTNANRLVFDVVNMTGVLQVAYYLPDCWNTAAPMSIIDAALAADKFVIVQVDFLPDIQPQFHWVRYLGNGIMIDPWFGDETVITRYRGKNAAECIRAVVIYNPILPR